jgi:hypothetical protein
VAYRAHSHLNAFLGRKQVLAAKIIYSGRFYFEASTGPSQCGLNVFEVGSELLAIVSELTDNKGMSVTNAADRLAEQIRERFGRPGLSFSMVEHYPGDREAAERFAYVHLAWNNTQVQSVRWSPASRQEITDRVGAFQVEF